MSDKTLGTLWLISSIAGLVLAYVSLYLSDHPTPSRALALKGDQKPSETLVVQNLPSGAL